MSDLKPCPFCGGVELVSAIDAGETAATDLHSIECSRCGGRSKETFTYAEACAHWNQRAYLALNEKQRAVIEAATTIVGAWGLSRKAASELPKEELRLIVAVYGMEDLAPEALP